MKKRYCSLMMILIGQLLCGSEPMVYVSSYGPEDRAVNKFRVVAYCTKEKLPLFLENFRKSKILSECFQEKVKDWNSLLNSQIVKKEGSIVLDTNTKILFSMFYGFQTEQEALNF
ncbi:hypothetical protein HYV11_02105 [Candidatus Dependentiae bacterium]|nr:hypothetical protein [Candidatus Dependentiae bacterium]